MPQDDENASLGYHYVSGFGSLADFIASDEDHSTAIYRRFDALAARDLLYYQSELAELETLQKQYDIEDAKDVEDVQKSDLGGLIRRHSRDWTTFRQAADGVTSISNDRWKKRMELAMEIRRTLREYREALIQESALLSLKHPSQQSMAAISNYFHIRATSHEAEPNLTTYPLLTGASSYLFPKDMIESQIRSSDLVSLSRHQTPDLLTYFLKTWCSCIFRTRPRAPLLPQHNISHLPRRQVVYYSLHLIQLAASFVTTFMAAILLFVPIYVLYHVAPSQPGLTMGLIALFVALFAVAIVVMTNARRAEVFGACAAYAAVLVVFVSGDFTGAGGSRS